MTDCKHKQLLDMDNQPVFCEECGGKICDKCGRCFACKEVYLVRVKVPWSRFRCKCGIFVKKPSGVFPGEDRIVFCTRGHSITYHEPATYYVQGFRDPITHIIGDDANRGLAPREPLRTISEAMSRVVQGDSIFLPRTEGDEG